MNVDAMFEQRPNKFTVFNGNATVDAQKWHGHLVAGAVENH